MASIVTETDPVEGLILNLARAAILIWLDLRSDFLRDTTPGPDMSATDLETEPIVFMNRLMRFAKAQIGYISIPGDKASEERLLEELIREIAQQHGYVVKVK